MERHTLTTALAITFVVLLAGLAVFQLLLVAGLPLGRFAWGGQHNILPPRLRVGSVISVLIYVVFAFVALERGGMTNAITAPLVEFIAMWVIAGYLVLGVLMNLASKSPQEKRVMVPVALGLAILAILIAVG
jgi:hypothetical protein